ncbi:MAG: TIGR03790 family protein [Proteobacteria bacterium]|nr:TIGR03790 family protein [Pseudomonadota bacterium]
MGLEPSNVFVIANQDVKESLELAEYYIKQRQIPFDHLIRIKTGKGETLIRNDYEKEIARPVRNYLRQKKQAPNMSCLVLMYGIPLRIIDSGGNSKQHKKRKNDPATDMISSVDSEMALVYEEAYPLSGWIKNPLFSGSEDHGLFIDRRNVFLVSRLDGPSPELVQRLINDSIDVEKTGLKGKAYFDARWPEAAKGKLTGYLQYDRLIHQAARKMNDSGLMPVILNSSEDVFQEKECPDAALYCGWYSLGKYVDAFGWVKGAVGYHVASSECTTLKKKGSQVWCKVMIEKGVSATLGPVGEPYVQAFPHPDVFFALLSGGMCLAESYMKSIPFLSWKMVLVGDPLYTPFKNLN